MAAERSDDPNDLLRQVQRARPAEDPRPAAAAHYRALRERNEEIVRRCDWQSRLVLFGCVALLVGWAVFMAWLAGN